MQDEATERWQPKRDAEPAWPNPPLPTAVLRGIRNTCPACARTPMFQGWLSVDRDCNACGAPLSRVRADDAPPYFVILVTGHIVVPLMLWYDNTWSPPTWQLGAIFLPLTLVMAVALLRPVKGGCVGLMLKLGLLRDDGRDNDPAPG